MSGTPMFYQTVEFDAGAISLYEDGTAAFHFRGMDYVYMPGKDAEDGMRIILDKTTTDAIKRLFRNEAGGY